MKHRLIKLITGFALLPLGFVGTAMAGQNQDVPPPALEDVQIETDGLHARINKIEAFLNHIDTLRAPFTQIADDGTITHGILSLDRPGRMRFEFTDDTPLLLVSDGKILSFIDYDVGQVTRWPVKDTALGILVAEKVDLEAANAMISRLDIGESSILLVSATDPERPEHGNITLLFEDNNLDDSLVFKGWEVMDGQGRVTRVRLEDTLINTAQLDNALWTFDDPRKLPSQRRRRGR